MKTLLGAALIAASLAGCMSDEELAAHECYKTRGNPVAYENCQERFQVWLDRHREQDNALAPYVLRGVPVTTNCMNIGGIVSCTSR